MWIPVRVVHGGTGECLSGTRPDHVCLCSKAAGLGVICVDFHALLGDLVLLRVVLRLDHVGLRRLLGLLVFGNSLKLVRRLVSTRPIGVPQIHRAKDRGCIRERADDLDNLLAGFLTKR